MNEILLPLPTLVQNLNMSEPHRKCGGLARPTVSPLLCVLAMVLMPQPKSEYFANLS